MAPTPKRRTRSSRSDDSVEIGPNGVLVEQEAAKNPWPPQQEEEEIEGRDALLLLSRSPQPKRAKPSAEPASAPRPKGDDGRAGEATKPSRRTWSVADEIRILEALAARHTPPDDADKAFYDSLLGLLDDKSCHRRELKDKVRSLQRRYENDTSKGVIPSGDHERRLHDLSKTIWGGMPTNAAAAAAAAANQVENGNNAQAESSEQALPDAGEELEAIHKRYPYLAQEVMGFEPAEREMFNMALLRMDDGRARKLDARIKKFRLAKLKFESKFGLAKLKLDLQRGKIKNEMTKATIELLRPTSSMATTLRVHYGVGTIREGPNGVDLNDFPQVTLVLPDDENARMTDVQYWLTQSFSLDPEVCSVVVQALWSWSPTDIRWELKTLVRSASWKGFVQRCQRRGYECVLLVQPCSLQAAAQARASALALGGASSLGGPHVSENDEVARHEADAG